MERRIVGGRFSEKVQQDLHTYSLQGFRTLVLSSRIIQTAEYASFQQELSKALQLHTNREEALDRVYDKMESNLELVAVTAVEDEL